jgi:hypothetical protein
MWHHILKLTPSPHQSAVIWLIYEQQQNSFESKTASPRKKLQEIMATLESLITLNMPHKNPHFMYHFKYM